MEERLYPVARVVLRKLAVESLSEVPKDLEESGLELEAFKKHTTNRPILAYASGRPTRTCTIFDVGPKIS